MLKAQFLYAISLWFLFLSEALAQSPLEKVKFAKVSATLSSAHVACILQDSRGFLWVGTEDGLNRFDGYEFKVYRHDPADSTSLLKNVIHGLFEDSRGVLWVSTSSGGLHLYNREQDNFTRRPQYSFNCEVVAFHEDDTAVWFGGLRKGKAFVTQVNKKTGRERYHTLFDSRDPVHVLIPASEHEFWVGIRNAGLFLWDVEKKYIHKQGSASGFHRAVIDAQHNLWMATTTGLQKFDVATQEYTLYNTRSTPALPVDNVLSVCMDGNYLWIGTENGGLCRLNTMTQQMVTFQSTKNDAASLPDNSIQALYKDRESRIWIGTYSNGLAVIDRLREKFMEVDLTLENDVVNAVLFDSKHRLWVGTEDGLVMKSPEGVKYYRHTTAKSSLQTNPVLAIYEDGQRRIWVGTWSGSLHRYDEDHDNFIHYMPDETRKESLSNPNVFSISESGKTKQLLVATYDGLNVLTDERRGAFEHIHEGQFEFNNYIRALYEDKRGHVWVGTIEELLHYNPTTKTLTRFETATRLDSIQVGGSCNSIFEDRSGRLWVGTSKGLHLLVDGKFKRKYTTKDGLPNNVVQSILEDNSGLLWLSTAGGISRFNPKNGAFRNYDMTDGLRSNDFRPNACFRNERGQMFFGGKGISVFNPDSIHDNPYVPEVFITDLSIQNKRVRPGHSNGILQQQISETKTISLPPAYNFFSLDYVALNFTATAKNQYAYKLEGFHTDWNYVGDQRSAMFTNLDPGTYTFKVKACNNDGVWNVSGASLVIHILPPWWKTWWATSAAVFLLIGFVLSLYKFRVRNIKKQNRTLELLVKERTQELAQQNDEISTQRDLMSEQNQELQKAREIIETQNNEITLRNETLEAEVEERTRDLVEYNQQLEQFSFISAHNLRAPVARILGLGHILDINGNDHQETRLIVDKLVLTTRELDRVVRDLSTVLDLRKNATSVIAPIDIEEELRLIKLDMEKEIKETQTLFVENFSKGKILFAVKPYVHSILINLISNAIKYRHPRRTPVIDIRSEVSGDHFYLTIQDNGLGIDMRLCKDKLFTLYSRFHLHVEGKGMGLFLVKTQVTAMGGKIEVDSKLNEGTVFRISFKRTNMMREEQI